MRIEMSPEQKAQEERWAAELYDCQCKFKARLHGAFVYSRNKTKRRAYYIALKAEIGDTLAKEVARFAEALVEGKIQYPDWMAKLPENYIEVPKV